MIGETPQAASLPNAMLVYKGKLRLSTVLKYRYHYGRVKGKKSALACDCKGGGLALGRRDRQRRLERPVDGLGTSAHLSGDSVASSWTNFESSMAIASRGLSPNPKVT